MIPTSTDVRLRVEPRLPSDLDAVLVFAAEGARLSGDAPMILPPQVLSRAHRLLEAEIVRGAAKEVDFDVLEMGKGRLLRVYAAGLGASEKISAESVRRSAGAVMRAIRKHRLRHIGIVPPMLGHAREHSGAEAVVTGLLLAAFNFREFHGTAHKYEPGENGQASRPTTVTLLAQKSAQKLTQQAVDRGRVIADAQNFARTIAARPGNSVNPPALAKIAQDLARQRGLRCRVLDEKQMKKLGMGGILAVGGGSPLTPPRMIALEYQPRGKSKRAPLLVVGKAITFDTGGISIKPADKMGKLIYDKCGAMAVLGMMDAIAQLKPDVPVIGIMSSAENHISGSAYRPGDILTMYNGVTVEVTNTDAEGRLVLGDALAWGIETYKPSAVVDLATLTGGVVVALGREMCGLMSNSDALVAELNKAAADTGEKMWRLPIGPEQRDQIRSECADIVNSAGREAHPLQGGAFLSYFVPENANPPWAHLDIAGVADTDKEMPYYAKGPTGFGVRTLVSWVNDRAENGAPQGHGKHNGKAKRKR